MRWFFMTVGVLAWLFALAVLRIFSESGGALAVIAAGVFAGVAIMSLGLERILKLLEDIRDRAMAGSAAARDERSAPEVARSPIGPIPA
jgi:hypothetical protein